jgi:hypothetical protein
MKVWMDIVGRHYGKRPIIYTPVDFHRENLDGHFQNYQFWLRSVAAHPQDIYPDHPWTFWQYTGTGMMPGIKGDTDINAFAGSKKQWRSLAAQICAVIKAAGAAAASSWPRQLTLHAERHCQQCWKEEPNARPKTDSGAHTDDRWCSEAFSCRRKSHHPRFRQDGHRPRCRTHHSALLHAPRLRCQ